MSEFYDDYRFDGVTKDGKYEIFEKGIYEVRGITYHMGCVLWLRPKDVSLLPIICRFYRIDYDCDNGKYVKAKKQFLANFDKKGDAKNGKGKKGLRNR